MNPAKTLLQDTSPAALVKAIEDNIFFFIPNIRKWPQAEVHVSDEIQWCITNVPHPLFNSVFRARLAPHQIDPTIQSIIARASERNVSILWWTGPQTQPADLGSHLEAWGFTKDGHEPGMAIDLDNINEDWPFPPGFSVQPVSDLETLKGWCQVCIQGFGMPGSILEPFFDLASHIGSGNSIPYLGFLNGKPVATSLVSFDAGVAGIYNVATLPEARHKGIGTWITLTPLLDARLRGYRVATLQASEMGANIYRRLGFQEYCQIGYYLWSPPTDQ